MAFNPSSYRKRDYEDDAGYRQTPHQSPVVTLDDISDLNYLAMPVRPGSSVSNLSRSSGFLSQISYARSVDGGVLVPASTVGGATAPPSEAGGVPVPPSTIGASSTVTNGRGNFRPDFQNHYASSAAPSAAHAQGTFIPTNTFANRAANIADPFSGGGRANAPTAYNVPPNYGPPQNTAWGNGHDGSSVASFNSHALHTSYGPPPAYNNGYSNGLTSGSRGSFDITPSNKTPRKSFGGYSNGRSNPGQFGYLNGQQNVPSFGTPRGRGRGNNRNNFSPQGGLNGPVNGYGNAYVSQPQFGLGGGHMNGHNQQPQFGSGSSHMNGYHKQSQFGPGYNGTPQFGPGYTNSHPQTFNQGNRLVGNTPNNMSIQLYQPPITQPQPPPYYGQQQFASPQANFNSAPFNGNFQPNGSMSTPVKNFNSFPPSTPRPSAQQVANRIRSGALSDGKRCEDAFRDLDATPTRGSRGGKRDRRRQSVQFGDTPSRTGGHSRSGSNVPSSRTSVTSTPSNSTQSTAMISFGQTLPRPGWFHKTQAGMKPTIDEALASLPLVSPFPSPPAETRGVVKFTNIPYNTVPSELIMALGKRACPLSQPPGSPYYAVHIIMDRMTGKTEEGFVEVTNLEEARKIVANINRREGKGSRVLKIGSREVEVDVATQEELMTKLFPCCEKAVIWKGCTPRVVQKETNYYADSARQGNFSGFVSAEETTALAKFASNPARSAFIERIPHRVHENIISTLHKIPWHTPQFITLGQRKRLYDAARACIRGFVKTLRAKKLETHSGMSVALLQELIVAVLSCVGFSEQQKSAVVQSLSDSRHADLTTGFGMNVRLGGRDDYSDAWPFLVLGPMASIDLKVLEYYAELIAEATEDDSNMSLREMAVALTNDSKAAPKPRPFGNLNVHYNSDDMANMDLREIVQCELSAVEHILRLKLTSIVTLGPFELPA